MGKQLGRPVMVAGVALIMTGLVGCAHVQQEEFDDEISSIRSELDEQSSRIDGNSSRIDELSSRMDGLENELQQLRDDFQARITELENGIRFAMPVHFEFDESDIRSVDRPVLDRFASVVQSYYGNSEITIEGFADPAGSRAYNQRLSLDRANSVKQYLVQQGGLSAGQLKTVAYGETENRQVRPGEQGPGRSGLENRRVTFVVEFGGMGG